MIPSKYKYIQVSKFKYVHETGAQIKDIFNLKILEAIFNISYRGRSKETKQINYNCPYTLCLPP